MIYYWLAIILISVIAALFALKIFTDRLELKPTSVFYILIGFFLLLGFMPYVGNKVLTDVNLLVSISQHLLEFYFFLLVLCLAAVLILHKAKVKFFQPAESENN